MDYLLEFLMFGGKVFVVVVGLIISLGFIALLATKNKVQGPQISIEDLNKKYNSYKSILAQALLSKKETKALQKEEKKTDKKAKKETAKNRLFVIDFIGGVHANEVEQFRDEVTAILTQAKPEDEVVIRLESGGGVVHGYGLAAAQILRLKNHGCKVTACVDKVAASVGYMMACTADQIVSAPFAILGSIGVLAQIPNFHKLLKKYNVDFHEVTAGKYKRTLTTMGEVTDEKKDKMKEQIEEVHVLFKDFVKTNRPVVELDRVATGEYWFGKQALELKLADSLQTSDDYLFSKKDDYKILKVTLKKPKSFTEKLTEAASIGVDKAVSRVLNDQWFPKA